MEEVIVLSSDNENDSFSDMDIEPVTWDAEIIVPKDSDTLAEEKKKLGNDQYKVKNYQAALKLYSDAISLCPNSAAYYANRAACYMMMSNYRNALADARTAVSLDANFEKAYVRIVKCCLAMGDSVGAEQAIAKLKELDQNSSAIKGEQQSLRMLKDMESTIVTNYEKGSYRNVVYYLDRALKIAPGCLRYRLLKGECLAFLGRCDEAVDIALSVMKLDSSSADAVYVRGLCLYYTDNLEKGILHFERALHLDPDHQKAKEMRAKCKRLKTLRENGNALYKAGRYREALTVYTDALKVDELNRDVISKILHNRALVNLKIGTIRDVIADCTSALQINAQYRKALVLRARCYNDLEKFEECIKDYEAAQQLQKTAEIEKLVREAKFALKRSKRKDYYKILGVARNATDDEVKKAYRRKAIMHHPDKHAASDADVRKEEEVKFKEIGEAYAVLSDPKKRSRHDNGQDIDDQQLDFDPNKVHRQYFQFNGSSGTSYEFEL